MLEQKFDVNRACFSQGKTPEFTKMGEIHELFVLALSLAWFAGATPESNQFLLRSDRGKLASNFCSCCDVGNGLTLSLIGWMT